MTSAATSFYTPPGRNTLLRPLPASSNSSLWLLSLKSKACVLTLVVVAVRFYARRTTNPALVNGSFVVTLAKLCRGFLRSRMMMMKSGRQGDEKGAGAQTDTTAVATEKDNDDDDDVATNNASNTWTAASTTTDDSTPTSSCFAQMQEVLLYWFGQHTMDQARHCLWMIPAGSPQQAHVDADIASRFQSMLFPLAASSQKNSRLLQEWTSKYGYLGKIAAIVVLDQFSRHVLRHRRALQQQRATLEGNGSKSTDDNLQPDSFSQQDCDQLALQTTRLFLQEHAREIQCGMIPHHMYIFATMPLRHVATLTSVQEVQQHVQQLEQLTEQCDTMVRRFRQATNRRMAVLQDEQRRTNVTETQGSDDNANREQPTTNDNVGSANDDILECGHFHADMGPSAKHAVHQAIVSFLQQRNIFPNQEQPIPVIISLSGGVDSMVIASALSYLARDCRYNLQIKAVHIDYANRPESSAEAAYCQYYCRHVLGNVDLEICRIDHVTRGVTARDEYESVSRQVRFDAYRRAIQQAVLMTGADSSAIGIFLGHHRGDLRENVLSNAHKGCGPMELSGMTAVSRNDGVNLFRPLLSLEKKFIFDYAHAFGVPYFKDTTPHWSTRGKLRNKLMPLLEEIYGEGSMNNLSDLAMESDQCRELLRTVLFGPFLDQVKHKPMGIVFDTASWKDQGIFFWKFVLREALHSAAIGMFSDKAVATLLTRIQAPQGREGWLQCRKDCGVYLQGDGRVFVLHAASFPWRKFDKYDCDGQQLGLGSDNTVQVGPWRIEAEQMIIDSTDLLRKKAIFSMDDIMDGSIVYYLQARMWKREVFGDEDKFEVRPLVFQTFTKPTRPEAWKNTDGKIQETLPLAGVDAETATAMKDPMGCGACHVSIETNEIESNPIALVKVTLKLVID